MSGLMRLFAILLHSVSMRLYCHISFLTAKILHFSALSAIIIAE